MKTLFGIVIIIIGIVVAIWLSLYVMLYGGIMQAVSCWGSDDSAVVWGIIRAVLSGVGVVPGYLLIFIGARWLEA